MSQDNINISDLEANDLTFAKDPLYYHNHDSVITSHANNWYTYTAPNTTPIGVTNQNYTLAPPSYESKISVTKIELNGKDLGEILDQIQNRLNILVPDPKKLEKYQALQQAYEHYKTLEALCQETDSDE
jgi:hypothetical protein